MENNQKNDFIGRRAKQMAKLKFSRIKNRGNDTTFSPAKDEKTVIVPERRLELLCDEGTYQDLTPEFYDIDPISFPGYPAKISAMREKTGHREAYIYGTAKVAKRPVVIGVMDSRFMMGSLGVAVGEMVARTFEKGTELHCPVLIMTCSGGARMQEGLPALFQMAKTAAAVRRFKDAGGLYITYLMHPTTGGVSASFAGLGDIVLAEPHALIGFAGPRVIEQTIGEKLPRGFQRSEYLLKHGFIDCIVPYDELREKVRRILLLHSPGKAGGKNG